MNLPPVSAAVSSPISAPTVTPPLPDAARRPVGEAANTPNRTERPAEDRAADKAQSAAPSRDALESAAKAEEYGLAHLGSLPLNLSIRQQADAGCPTVVAEPDGEIAALYRSVARGIAIRIADKAKDYSSKFPTITISKST